MSRSGRNTTGSKRSVNKGQRHDDAAPYLRSVAEWKGYVNVEQSDSTREHFRRFSDDSQLVSEAIAEALLAGYKLSVVQDDNDETCKATAYAAFKGMPDSGLSVSAWAGGALEAIAAVVYIVVIQSARDLSQWDKPEERVRRRTF